MGWFIPNVEKMKAKGDVKGLIKALKNKDVYIRTAAVETLGKIGDSIAVEPLVQPLQNDVPIVREAAVIALGNIKDSSAVEPLIKALNDKREDILNAVARALGKIGDARAVEPLNKAIKDSKAYLKQQEKRFGQMEDPIARDPIARELLIQAKRENDKRFRESAEWALGKIGKSKQPSSKKGTAKVASKKTKKQSSAGLKGPAVKFESLDSFQKLICSKYNLSTHEYRGTIEPETLLDILERVEDNILIYWTIKKDTEDEVGISSVFSSQVEVEIFAKDSPKDEESDSIPFTGLAKFHNEEHLDYYLKSGRYDKADMGIGNDLIFSRFMFNTQRGNWANQPYSRKPVTVDTLRKRVAKRQAELGLQ